MSQATTRVMFNKVIKTCYSIGDQKFIWTCFRFGFPPIRIVAPPAWWFQPPSSSVFKFVLDWSDHFFLLQTVLVDLLRCMLSRLSDHNLFDQVIIVVDMSGQLFSFWLIAKALTFDDSKEPYNSIFFYYEGYFYSGRGFQNQMDVLNLTCYFYLMESAYIFSLF